MARVAQSQQGSVEVIRARAVLYRARVKFFRVYVVEPGMICFIDAGMRAWTAVLGAGRDGSTCVDAVVPGWDLD